MYKHYTIYCAPKEFDNKFKTFVEELESTEPLKILDIQHHDYYHYILYSIYFKDDTDIVNDDFYSGI